MHILFWISISILVYTFAVYPAIIFILSRFFRRKSIRAPYVPKVTFIITAYNEAKVLSEKIINTLALEYPREKLEVFIASDGSTDGTDSIAQNHANAGVRLLRIEGRVGKTACQNKAVEAASGEIIVFSDANSMYDKEAIKNIVVPLQDPKIGLVCGELRYTRGGGETIYWNFERWLKLHESSIHSCLGANGAIYAVRKAAYTPLPHEVMSDFALPFNVFRQHLRVVYEPHAWCVEEAVLDAKTIARKRRIILRALSSLGYVSNFLFAWNWYCFLLWSRKFFRWLAFIFLLTTFISTCFLLTKPLYMYVFLAQVVCYMLAILGAMTKRKPFIYPYVFLISQIAAFLAVKDWLLGKRQVAWQTERTASAPVPVE